MFFKAMIHAIKPFTKIFATLHDGYKIEANWMTGHTDLAKWYWKNKYLIVLS
jgi:hypothetical protein